MSKLQIQLLLCPLFSFKSFTNDFFQVWLKIIPVLEKKKVGEWEKETLSILENYSVRKAATESNEFYDMVLHTFLEMEKVFKCG